ncbi:MAG: hypothetical protein QOK16_3618 [Solirubrobacteraceae bacterium]|nr:hypothetical protein [Solirubrobacteraceae bacterium]
MTWRVALDLEGTGEPFGIDNKEMKRRNRREVPHRHDTLEAARVHRPKYASGFPNFSAELFDVAETRVDIGYLCQDCIRKLGINTKHPYVYTSPKRSLDHGSGRRANECAIRSGNENRDAALNGGKSRFEPSNGLIRQRPRG